MSDLIRREDAIKAYNEAMDELVKWQMEEWQLGDFSECEFNTTDCKHIVRKLEAIPTIDAVSVVRCEDCKRSEGCDQMVLISEIYNEVEEAEPITYCSYGERKERE